VRTLDGIETKADYREPVNENIWEMSFREKRRLRIDDLPHDHAFIPEKFRQLHWQAQLGSTVDAAFVDRVKLLYREHQSRTVVRT